MSPGRVVKARPAETTAFVLGTGGLIAAIAERNWQAAATAIVGFVPAAATYLFEHGGIRGVTTALWRGRS